MTTRIEHDLLGEREIPNDAYWGIHTLRAAENFKISKQKISDIPEFVRGMVMVKKATARANAELGVLSAEVAAAIDAACDEVLVKGRCLDQFPSDVFQGGAGTSVNMNTNEVVANLALEHLGKAKGSYDIIDPMPCPCRWDKNSKLLPSCWKKKTSICNAISICCWKSTWVQPPSARA